MIKIFSIAIISLVSFVFYAVFDITRTNDIPKDHALEVAIGNVPGMFKVNKFGEAIDCDSGDSTDVWDGANGSLSTKVWVPPTQARTHTIASSDANDTATGSGMRTIKIYGLKDWNFGTTETNEVLTMNTGSPPVSSEFVVIHRMHGVTWGALGQNQGNITATATTDGTITAAILALQNQTQMIIYGIAAGQILAVSFMQAQIVKGTGTSQRADGEILWMTDPATNAADNTAWTNKENFLLVEGQYWSRPYPNPKTFTGPGILKIRVVTNSNGTKTIAAFDAKVITL